MDITWDPDKANLNRAEHRVSFPDAEAVLYDPYAITREDETAQGEQRLVTLGLDALGRLLVVVYTAASKSANLPFPHFGPLDMGRKPGENGCYEQIFRSPKTRQRI